MAVAYYSPEDVTILLGGVYKIDGLHEGSFLSISKDEQQFKTYVSTDGKVTRSHVNHPLHTVKITTASVSDVNNVLSTLATADSKLYGTVIPLFIKDVSGTTLFYTSDCWIEGIPEIVMGDTVEPRVWTIKAVDAVSVVGGNGSGGVIPPEAALVGVVGSKFMGLI